MCRHKIGADVRVLMSSLLAKLHQPDKDIRKPYNKLGSDSFGGRGYDTRIISGFVTEHRLPVMRTTGFLTPAFRTKNIVLTRSVNLGGDSPELDAAFLSVLNDVHDGKVSAEDVLAEVVRCLLLVKAERDTELEGSLTQLRALENGVAISAEGIVKLIQQHMDSSYSSRLPVLVVVAAYNAASHALGERALPLQSHNAADKQTGALGDVEITLVADNRIITTYEMKDKRVARDDIDQAVAKTEGYWRKYGLKLDNYIFITTKPIDNEVREYAADLYDSTGGIEFVILDCIGFLRHFLHLFHRLRMQFLEEYQTLVLAEPDSAVRHELKVTFLALRRAAESRDINIEENGGEEDEEGAL